MAHLFNLPKQIKPLLNDSDRTFINQLSKELDEMDVEKKWVALSRYEIVWCGVIWKMSTEKNLKFKKLFKQLNNKLLGKM